MENRALPGGREGGGGVDLASRKVIKYILKQRIFVLI